MRKAFDPIAFVNVRDDAHGLVRWRAYQFLHACSASSSRAPPLNRLLVSVVPRYPAMRTTALSKKHAVMRVPPEGETRANFHAGGAARSATLDAADQRIVERLAPRLREEGLFFVGIDVIGGYRTEINVPSPTGVLEIDALESRCLEAEILDALESRLRAHMETA